MEERIHRNDLRVGVVVGVVVRDVVRREDYCKGVVIKSDSNVTGDFSPNDLNGGRVHTIEVHQRGMVDTDLVVMKGRIKVHSVMDVNRVIDDVGAVKFRGVGVDSSNKDHVVT